MIEVTKFISIEFKRSKEHFIGFIAIKSFSFFSLERLLCIDHWFISVRRKSAILDWNKWVNELKLTKAIKSFNSQCPMNKTKMFVNVEIRNGCIWMVVLYLGTDIHPRKASCWSNCFPRNPFLQCICFSVFQFKRFTFHQVSFHQ